MGMIKSKYSAALKTLSKKAVFSSTEGREAGIPPRMLAYFYSKGQIERVNKGVYKINNLDFESEFEWEDLAITALSIPNGVICLISAPAKLETGKQHITASPTILNN